jgi:hypothetical protein
VACACGKKFHEKTEEYSPFEVLKQTIDFFGKHEYVWRPFVGLYFSLKLLEIAPTYLQNQDGIKGRKIAGILT